MNARERFNAVMHFETPDRLPFMEFMFYWPETRDRWNQEGMPPEASPVDYFGYDRHETVCLDFNPFPPFEITVLEEDEETRVVRNAVGVIKREFKYGSAMPHFIEFPIKSRRDFWAFKERLDPMEPGRYPADWEQQVTDLRGRDYPAFLVCRGLLAFLRDFMDFNQMATIFLEEPEWVEEMLDFHTDFIIRYWERALSEVEVDMVVLGEDMAFKTGPMISPDLVRHFMVPRYKRIADFLKAHGVTNRFIDSDGYIASLVPLYLEAGMTGVLPLENVDGYTIMDLRQQYPRLQMIGGIDKQAIAKGGEHIQRELRRKVGKVGPLGGYIPSFDHSVHPQVPLQTYKDYLSSLRQYCGTSVAEPEGMPVGISS